MCRSGFALIFLLAVAQSYAADSIFNASSPVDNPQLTEARALIRAKNWGPATALLEMHTADDAKSADGFNLLGYSYRQLGRYDASFAAYKRALTLDPNHRGAHEYIGIAYLQIGQLQAAQDHLAHLSRICGPDCEEYQDLHKAYQAAVAAK